MNDLRIIPIDSEERMILVEKAMASDGHTMYQPTHAFMIGGDVVGAIRGGAVSTGWVREDQNNAKLPILMFSFLDCINGALGRKSYSFVVSTKSPFLSKMEKLGFQLSHEDTMMEYRRKI